MSGKPFSIAAVIVRGALMMAVVIFATVQGALARPLDDVLADGKLRVIAYLDNAPFSWEEADGTPRGIEVELGRAIARELGVAAEIVLRMQGEKADDDLRANVWRGPLTGGGTGDLMLHVPIDREFALRNKEAVLGNAYYQERIAVAIHPDMIGNAPTFEAFREHKIAVQLGTVADYFLMRYDNGALINKITHHVKAEVGAKEFANREVAALMGVRSRIEALLGDLGMKPVMVEPNMDGIVRRDWIIGMAWKENSRDLGYAVAAALQRLTEKGEIAKIFGRFGVTHIAPPIDDRRTGE